MWNSIKETVGYAWPNGDPTELRAAAALWRHTGSAFANAATSLGTASTSLDTQHSDQIPSATAYLTSLKDSDNDFVDACGDLGTTCSDLARAIDDAHHELISDLTDAAIELGVTEVVVDLLFFIGGEVWGQFVVGGRAALLATRLAGIIRRLIELAKAAGRIAKAAMGAHNIGSCCGSELSTCAAVLSCSTIRATTRVNSCERSCRIAVAFFAPSCHSSHGSRNCDAALPVHVDEKSPQSRTTVSSSACNWPA